ncbi:nickel transport protein [Paucidesulfovibrio gracilis DSM 16080]|uniref:Nickel transport protein n=1 Tax=Paucidesulfovibrio gracilis DSM 16080 TaxID=1121449 RepID=A0A1T4XF84_9BACT|nr:hypothetical protein [Paucidesulfovibrio gracilis]SKA88274.1 nickel transport protein [Paucidesulfovibrio gracilis DSM 16080]
MSVRTAYPALLAALVLLLGCALPAQAHRVKIFAYTDGETIYTESSFSQSSPAKGAAITVTDARGETVHQGYTDDDGKHDFPIPANAQGDLTITVDAGEGHQNQWVLTEAEYR